MVIVSRAERLLSLVQVLRRYRQPVSAQVLADALQVSVRSIYRDIQTLRGQGAVIEGEAGVGYLLKPGYLLPPLMFSDEELEALVLGLRLSWEHGDEALGRSALEVAAKLRAVLPKELRALFSETGLLAGPARERPPERIDLAVVRKVIREQKKARIDYEDKAGAPTQRVIWPIALAFFERARVVLAWCETRNDYRAFRADRIVTFTPLDARYPKSRQSMLDAWREREGIRPPEVG